ncbi:DUF2141 domain-containing protein [Lacihabitans sp. LS3-19]|uniref:DUF2141 domain-containing protein n=1 Tax=Lacihabitans sp. LS3-19 TaxID=2487335 RepID=UPI0020CCF6D6|nr:DUF2141 domain-containing protein [Lacihabitans sp. LS3-19]MCP9770282.1 DUF2141 domain-containing protein [Lacihabitans sp. LS3-19]
MKVLNIVSFLMISFFCYGQTKPEFNLKIQNIKNTNGTLRIAFFKKGSDFPHHSGISFAKEVKISKAGEVETKFSDVPHGEYAVAIFHDENGNKKLDKNIVGIPTEPYGFTRNFKPKFSAPVFTDCNIVFNQTSNSFIIKLLD